MYRLAFVILIGACGRLHFDPGATTSDDAGGDGSTPPLDAGFTGAHVTYLKASNTQTNQFFGESLAVSHDGATLVVGGLDASAAIGIDGNQADSSAANAGSAYVFVRGGATWAQQAYVKASNTTINGFFGYSLALSADGNTMAIGAVGERSGATGVGGSQGDTSAFSSGAVYVFVRTGTAWAQQAYVKASNTGAGDFFGAGVALSDDGNTLVVGASQEGSATTGIDGDGADNSADSSGAAYVFTRSGTAWSQQAFLKASNTGAGDVFGSALALSSDGNTLAIGASQEDSAATGIDGNQADDSTMDAGAVYMFRRSGATWTQEAYVKPAMTAAGAEFGAALALSSDGAELVVGAPAQLTGVVFSFHRTGTTWAQDGSVAGQAGAFDWGSSLAMAGPNLFGGGALDLSNTGVLQLYARPAGTWSAGTPFHASNPDPGDAFGAPVVISRDATTIAVSAQQEASAATGVDGDQADNSAPTAGAVYVFD